jgi:hypothetical protein
MERVHAGEAGPDDDNVEGFGSAVVHAGYREFIRVRR